MVKGPEAFRTISEVAEILAVPQHVLRFWETRFSEIKPLKRGGGRRYYRPSDIDLLRGIRYLLHDKGYTSKGVQKLLKEKSVAYVLALGKDNSVALSKIIGKKKRALHGDLFANEASEYSQQRDASNRVEVNDFDEDILVNSKHVSSSRDNMVLLQDAIFELIECKRLLDRVRTE